MCGIVGAIAQRPVTEILLEGLSRLEYRGYDSAGLAIINADQHLQRERAVGKVVALKNKLKSKPLTGLLGIAHTRWATHGKPAERNAHPHVSNNRIAVVHNGIIENYEVLREELKAEGYQFESDTDTEVIVHLIEKAESQGMNLLEAVMSIKVRLRGAYALGVISNDEPDNLIIARHGSPLVIGLGLGENFIGSDIQALLPVTNRFIYLENGDTAQISRYDIALYDVTGISVEREIVQSNASMGSCELGEYRHFMHKEIFEQPQAIQATLDGRLEADAFVNCISGTTANGQTAQQVLKEVDEIQIIACGTSYHAGLIARYWIESMTDVPCNVEVASEFRYRRQPPKKNLLVITLSQ
jgi:glucosamine--fructose-6-phosphate aminotransferase (isomerizing)